MSNEFSDLFNTEVDEFQKKVKTEDEIQKMCTKDDLNELQRAIFLCKKGYEIQKISVINNLDRYLKEVGANEELLSLIIGSLEDWDDKMQIECAQSFIEPLKQKLLSKDNRQRILKLSIDIITNESNENEVLRQNWITVFDHVVGQVEFQYVQLVAFKAIQSLTDMKSTFPKRKLGNRLLTSLAKSCGEEAFEGDVKVLKQVMQICCDTNYKIRMDGAIFLKEYLQKNYESLVGSVRLTQTFLPDICELLNDEETYIRIEVIEGVSYVLETLDEEMIERELIPNLLKMLVFEDNHYEIINRMAQIIGKVTYKLQRTHLHLKYKEQFMNFFQGMCQHKTDEGRLSAAYNLPCFHQLFHKKESQSSLTTRDTNNDEESKEEDGDPFAPMPFDFLNAYYLFANDTNDQIRILTAGCLHEAFKLQSEQEDTTYLRDALHDLMNDKCNDVLVTIVLNVDVIIEKYANYHAVQTFNPADYPEPEVKQVQPPKLQLQRPVEKQQKDAGQGKPNLPKKSRTTSLNVQESLQAQEEDQNQSGSWVYLPEFPSEQLYSILLGYLINFKLTLNSKIALWRECVIFWEKLCITIEKFNQPELQDRILGLLFEDIQRGNQALRQVCCRVLIQILSLQQDSTRRQLLAQYIKAELGESNSFQMRKTFIIFCKEAVGHLRKQYFEENFYSTFLKLSTDKVSNVRLDFMKSLVQIKPFVDAKQQINQELSDQLTILKQDPNKEVVEATENTEYELLKQRKKVEQMLSEKEKQCVARQKLLDVREVKDAEEKKKRMEEDEENRYDYGNYGQTNRLGAGKNRTKLPLKATGVQPVKGTTTIRKTVGSATTATSDKTPTKRKVATGSQKSALPELKETTTAVSSNAARKHSLLLPSTGNTNPDKPSNTLKIPGMGMGKDESQPAGGIDNYKRYQQLVQAGSSTSVSNGYKRSQSLLESSKQKIVKKDVVGTAQIGGVTQYNYNPTKRKAGNGGTTKGAATTNGLSDTSSSSSEDITPTHKSKTATGSTTTANVGSIRNKQF